MQRILLIQLRQLGDIILTTPCIREVKLAFPNAEVDFLTHNMGRLVLPDNPYLNEIFCYSEKDSISQQWQLIKNLRSKKYDLAIDFMYNPRSALLCRLSGAKRRLAFPSRRKMAYTEIVPQPQETDYIVREKFHLLNHVGIQAKNEALILPWSEKHLMPYQEHKKLLFPEKTQLRVALSPTHRREARQWSKENYARLADWLVREKEAQVVWLWGPGEEEFVKETQALCQSNTSLAPKTGFRELAAFIANCDLFIGNSNGPSHVAVSCDIPSLQLHGPTLAKTWCPQSGHHFAIQQARMSDITLKLVQDKLEQMQPCLAKRLKERNEIGDRMSWNCKGMN